MPGHPIGRSSLLESVENPSDRYVLSRRDLYLDDVGVLWAAYSAFPGCEGDLRVGSGSSPDQHHCVAPEHLLYLALRGDREVFRFLEVSHIEGQVVPFVLPEWGFPVVHH